jgi:superfamily II DNA or RNA helicase
MENPWREGERVRVRGATWTIGAVQAHRDCVELRLNGGDREHAAILAPFDRPARLDRARSIRFVHPRRWLHDLRRAACDALPFGGLADPAADLTILPYQLEPALAVLAHGATRVLVADEVGLGKTVQAGLLLAALAARHPSLRALIVAPAGLRGQWAEEMRSRFALDVTIAGAAWLRRATRDLPQDVMPWAMPGVYVTSYDFLKRPEVLRPVEDLTWDLLVADEAHNAAPPTARCTALHAVARRCTRVLLLTATPHAGDAAQFDSLCALGAPRTSAPIVLFRRSRGDVGDTRPRRSVLLTVRPTPAEQRMHRVLERYISALSSERHRAAVWPARLASIVLKKRALSSAGSLAESARRRLALLAGDALPRQMPLAFGDEDPLEDDVPDGALGAPGLADPRRERQLLERVARAARSAVPESKPAFLLRLLARVREPAIVFTEYRDTLARLERTLASAGHRVTLMHGGLGPDERDQAQRRFNAEGGVLLATDAAAEGLNLHQRCRMVIHYELPWSPTRLEQRAGRVDRIGQSRRVHEILLVSGDAAEEIVLAPLARRAARARRAMGGSSQLLDRLSEAAVADAVLRGVPITEGEAAKSERPAKPDLRVEATLEAERLERCRRWRRISPRRSGDNDRPPAIVASRIRIRRRATTLTCVYRLWLRTAEGRLIHEELVATREHMQGVAGDLRQLADRRRQAPPEMRGWIEQRLGAVEAGHARVQLGLEHRARALRSEVASAARALVQAGLFDRRALRRRDAREHAAAALADRFDDEATAAASARTLSRGVDLVSVLLA